MDWQCQCQHASISGRASGLGESTHKVEALIRTGVDGHNAATNDVTDLELHAILGLDPLEAPIAGHALGKCPAALSLAIFALVGAPLVAVG